jgi:hypothetical protein
VNRSAQNRIAAHESWARTPDRAARTAGGYAGLLARFEREARERLGPAATDAQVAAAADSAKKAHFTRLGAASAARRAKSPA